MFYMSNQRMIRHSHVVLLSVFVCTFIFGSVSFASPRMLVSLIDTFHATRAEAGLILSIMMAFHGFASLFSGLFAHKFGARATGVVGSLVLTASLGVSFFATSVPFLVVTLGIFAGTGLAFLFAACTPTICEHFKGRSRTHAITFMTTGSSIGGMAYSYIIGHFIDQYGVRGTCLLLGGITLNAAVMTLLWNRHPNPNNINRPKHGSPCVPEHPTIKQNASREINSKEPVSINAAESPSIKSHVPRVIDTSASYSINAIGNPTIQKTIGSGRNMSLKEGLKSVLTDKIFMMFAFGNGLQLAVNFNARTYIVDTIHVASMLNEDKQLEYGSLAVFLYNLFSLFGKFLFAVLKQIPGCSALDINLLATVFGITGSLLIAVVESVTVRLVAWSMHGAAFGMYATSLSVATAKLLGKQRVAIGMGLVPFILGVGSTVGGPLNGYMRDVTGTYTAVFICTSVVLALGGIFVLVARFSRLKQKRTTSIVSSL